MPCVTCHMSHVTCHIYIFFFFFEQSGEAYRWKVFYKRGLPRLVYLFFKSLLQKIFWPTKPLICPFLATPACFRYLHPSTRATQQLATNSPLATNPPYTCTSLSLLRPLARLRPSSIPNTYRTLCCTAALHCCAPTLLQSWTPELLGAALFSACYTPHY